MATEIIYFNRIYIIESLLDGEIATGTSLHDDLVSRKVERMNNMHSDLISINNLGEFDQALKNIEFETKVNKIRPYLHFEIHGNKHGLVLKSKELVDWNMLYIYVHRINSHLRNQLFISLATCYGGYLFNSIDPLKRSPFYGYVGNVKEITTEQIEVGFYAYFETLLDKLDFNAAINRLNKENESLKTPFIFISSSRVFREAREKLESQLASPAAKEKKIKELVALAQNYPNITKKYTDDEIELLMKEKVNNRNKFMAKFERKSLSRIMLRKGLSEISR